MNLLVRSRSTSTLIALCAVGAVLGVGVGACDDAPLPEAPGPEPGAELLGGETTVFDESPNAFTRPARNITSSERDTFALGDHFFNRNWVAAPASTSANDGLGPLFNALSCSACHLHDGRSSPPLEKGDASSGLLFRLSVPGVDAHGAPLPDPSYGGQLQPLSLLGVPKECRYVISYEARPGTFADGEPYVLSVPRYEIRDLGYGPLASNAMTSPRTAPAMIGLGLLEAVPDEAIQALADPDDRDGDGISGRINIVWDDVNRKNAFGRFGWKANVPSVLQQVSGAFVGDIGITNRIFPDEACMASQRACRDAPNGGRPELADDTLDEVVLYSQTLAVPARRRIGEPQTNRGEALFAQAKCSSCHATRLVTGEATPVAGLRRQTIRPYTDLLLHDMGPDLADGRPDFLASGSEWRTAPLWGLGLHQKVSKHSRLLHDGRANGIVEAILWHGGEATAAREAFRTMAKDDREALLAFLRSL